MGAEAERKRERQMDLELHEKKCGLQPGKIGNIP
jgi:hypothetical protein